MRVAWCTRTRIRRATCYVGRGRPSGRRAGRCISGRWRDSIRFESQITERGATLGKRRVFLFQGQPDHVSESGEEQHCQSGVTIPPHLPGSYSRMTETLASGTSRRMSRWLLSRRSKISRSEEFTLSPSKVLPSAVVEPVESTLTEPGV